MRQKVTSSVLGSQQLQYLEALADYQKDKEDLRNLNLTDEEVEGAMEFFLDGYFLSNLDVI